MRCTVSHLIQLFHFTICGDAREGGEGGEGQEERQCERQESQEEHSQEEHRCARMWKTIILLSRHVLAHKSVNKKNKKIDLKMKRRLSIHSRKKQAVRL